MWLRTVTAVRRLELRSIQGWTFTIGCEHARCTAHCIDKKKDLTLTDQRGPASNKISPARRLRKTARNGNGVRVGGLASRLHAPEPSRPASRPLWPFARPLSRICHVCYTATQVISAHPHGPCSYFRFPLPAPPLPPPLPPFAPPPLPPPPALFVASCTIRDCLAATSRSTMRACFAPSSGNNFE